MAHEALFRKYRSQRFEGLTGQDHITRTLRNALRMDRVSHAYLFCGPRGTGKTSTARIFAKALNCLGPDPAAPLQRAPEEPCEKCANCNNIREGVSLDVIEMDAASNTGVDNVRDAIIGKVEFKPVEGRRKIYIVDEVHKLSGSAFAALLKTLEEPPEHLVFLLATTDPNDLPATILSRCQRFDFRRISQRHIVDRLRWVCEQEGFEIETEAMGAIAEAADGGLRDALVLLEQAASFANGPITLEVVAQMLGVTDRGSLFVLTETILGGKTGAALEKLDTLVAEGRDLLALARDMLGHIRALLMAKIAERADQILNVSEEVLVQLKAQASEFTTSQLTRAAQRIMALEKELKETIHGRLHWEVAIVDMAQADPRSEAAPAPRPRSEPASSPPRSEPAPAAPRPTPESRPPVAPEHRPSPHPPSTPPRPAPVDSVAAPPPTPATTAPADPSPAAAPASDGPVTLEAFQQAWHELVEIVRREKVGGSLHVFLADCRPLTVEGDNCIFTHPSPDRMLIEKLGNKDLRLSQRLSDLLKRQVQLKLRRHDPAAAAPRPTAAAPATPEQAHLQFVEETKQIFGGKTS